MEISQQIEANKGQKRNENVQLDIFFPYQFVKDTLAAHDNDGTSNIAFPWEDKSREDTNVITTQVKNDGNQKLLLISIQSVTFTSVDGKLSCKFKEIERDRSSSAWESVNSSSPYASKTENISTSSKGSSSQTKRKRGRPKKSERIDKENEQHSYSRSNDLNQASKTTLPAVNTPRYGLRGVKLSQAIMRAEKGLYYDTTSLKNNHQLKPSEPVIPHKSSTESDHDHIYKSTDHDIIPENPENQESNMDIGAESSEIKTEENNAFVGDSYWEEIMHDEEQFLYKKRKRGRPRKIRCLTENSPKKLKQKVDLGDIPCFERRKRNTTKKGECKYCKKQFCDYTGVDAHVRKFHGNEEDIETYLESIKDLKIEICSHCGEKFDNRVLLQVHENRAHFRNQPVQCNKCKKMYKNVLSLRNHIVAVHIVKGQPHLCHLCPAKFKWAMTLKQHIAEIHDGKMDYICKFCKKAFARKAQLKRHERIHGVDQTKKLICPVCNKGFWYECNLQRHEKLVHGPHKESHHCSYCGKGFNMKSAMVNHVQHVHLNIHTFKCSQCKMGFRRRKLLEDHMIQAHSEVNFKLKEVNRVRYKYGRSSEDLFYCSYCSLSFCYKTKMIEHMHIDHGKEFPFVCEHCSQGFMERGFLINHMRKAHDMEVEESDVTDNPLIENGSQCRLVTLELPPEQQTEEEVTSTQELHLAETMEVEEEAGEITVTEADTEAQVASVLLEVASGANTIHYLIQQPEDGGPTVIPTELSSLLLAAEIQESGEVELTCDGEGYTYLSRSEEDSVDDVAIENISSDIVIENSNEDQS